MLAAFPVALQQPAVAAESAAVAATAENNALPDLAPPAASQTRVNPGASGIAVTSNGPFTRFTAHTSTSQTTGTSVGIGGALALGEAAAPT